MASYSSVSKRFSLAVLASCMLAAGCSSPPKAVYADGSTRVPANDPQRVKQVQQTFEQNRALQSDNDVLRAQLLGMQKQVEDIKAAVTVALTMAMSQPQAPTIQVQPAQRPVENTAPSALPQKIEPQPMEKVVPKAFKPQSSLDQHLYSRTFARTFAVGEIQVPMQEQELRQLKEVAHKASVIEILGTADSNINNETNRTLASKRAGQYKQLLTSQGVDVNKLEVRSMPSEGSPMPRKSNYGFSNGSRIEIIFYFKDAETLALASM
jgi:outer membrane protein OmpA-like peptidoglycan-associated protein